MFSLIVLFLRKNGELEVIFVIGEIEGVVILFKGSLVMEFFFLVFVLVFIIYVDFFGDGLNDFIFVIYDGIYGFV